MTAELRAEQFVEQVRGAIDDRRHVGKIRRAVDHAEQADDAPHAIEIAELLLDGRKNRHGGDARGLFTLFDRHIGAELTGAAKFHVRMMRAVSRHKDDIANAHAAPPVGAWKLAWRG